MKICFKCKLKKPLDDFYVHKQMSDGHLGKCKVCARNDCKPSNGKVIRKCLVCEKLFRTNKSEIKRGGGKYCSRKCWIIGFSVGEDNPNWKGSGVGMTGLHKWVVRELGQPTKCEHCAIDGLTKCKINWANKSRKYKRDVSDWIRLCAKCHKKYDKKTPDFCVCGKLYYAKGMCRKCYMKNYANRNRKKLWKK